MLASSLKTHPDPKERGWPRGIAHIIGNEACERFSFYGMTAILKVYLVALLSAQSNGLSESAVRSQSTAVVHFFITGVYAIPMIGAVVADRWLGKYRTILIVSLVYCVGHAVLALTEHNLPGTYWGLALIALGAGGIKPCVSAHVGDQFGKGNWDKLEKVYQIFYFSVNLGSAVSSLLIPLIKERYGWSVAFGIPGVLMALATLVFWLGRKRFVHVPPNPGGRLGALDSLSSTLLFASLGVWLFVSALPWWLCLLSSLVCLGTGLWLFTYRQRCKPEFFFLATLWAMLRRSRVKRSDGEAQPTPQDIDDCRRVLRISSVLAIITVFWAIFYQYSSSWVDQASMMQREISIPGMNPFILLPEQTQSLNPLLVMLLIPITSRLIYPFLMRFGVATQPLRRMRLGMLIAVLSFVSVALLQEQLDAGAPLHVSWQLLPYGLITLAEVMISITGLEFAYAQAPQRMKSTIMGLWLLTTALGSILTGLLAALGSLALADFFWLFTALMALAALLFAWRVRCYKDDGKPPQASMISVK